MKKINIPYWIATIIIFLPLAFLSGVSGSFFKALSITMASGLILSCLITYLVIPLLADKFLNSDDANDESDGRITEEIKRIYEKIMERFFKNPAYPIAIILTIIVVGVLSYKNVGSGFLPSTDEGGFILDYKTLPGTSLNETDRLLRQVEDIIRSTPDVETYSRRTGIQLGGGVTEANEGDYFVRLKATDRRPVEAGIA